MTRGKYAAKAAARIVTAEVTTTIEDYQRKVRDLMAERDALKATLDAERKDRATEARRLRAERDEAVSPEVAARDHLIAKLRDETARLKTRIGQVERVNNALLGENTAAKKAFEGYRITAGRTPREAENDWTEAVSANRMRAKKKGDSPMGITNSRDDSQRSSHVHSVDDLKEHLADRRVIFAKPGEMTSADLQAVVQ